MSKPTPSLVRVSCLMEPVPRCRPPDWRGAESLGGRTANTAAGVLGGSTHFSPKGTCPPGSGKGKPAVGEGPQVLRTPCHL